MRAGELCIRDVATAYETETVVDIARRMADYDVGDVIVVLDQPAALPRPIGIVTDRDLVVDVLARSDRVPGQTTAGDVMNRDLTLAHEHDDIESVVAKMRARGIRRIPIVDDRGGLQGMLTLDDVLGWMRAQLDAAARAVETQGLGPSGRLR